MILTLIQKAVPWMAKSRCLLDCLASVLDLGIRLYLSKVFFRSGLTKIRDWDTTLTLFRDEYHVPVLPPELAAVMGTFEAKMVPSILPREVLRIRRMSFIGMATMRGCPRLGK